MTHADKDATCVVWPPRRVMCIPFSKPVPVPLPLLPLASELGESRASSRDSKTDAMVASKELMFGSTNKQAMPTTTEKTSVDILFDEAAVREFASAADAAAALNLPEADIQCACDQGSAREGITAAQVADNRLSSRKGGPVEAWWVCYSTEPGEMPTANTTRHSSANKETDGRDSVHSCKNSGTDREKTSAIQSIKADNEEMNTHKRRPLVLLDDIGNVLAQYESQTLAAEALGISKPMVSTCVRGLIAKAANKHRLRSVAHNGLYPTLNDEGWTEGGQAISSSSASLSETCNNEDAKEDPHRHKRKAVVLLDDYGKVLYHYDSQRHAAEALDIPNIAVSNCVRGMFAKVDGMHRLRAAAADGKYFSLESEGWTTKLVDSVTDIHHSRSDDSESNYDRSTTASLIAKSVVVLDDDGFVLQEYESQTMAARALGVHQVQVSHAVRDASKRIRGHRVCLTRPDGVYSAAPKDEKETNFLRDSEPSTGSHIPPVERERDNEYNREPANAQSVSLDTGRHHRCKEIVLLGENGQSIREFPSLASASTALNLPTPSISMCINGKIPNVRGFVFRLKTVSDETNSESTESKYDLTARQSSSPVMCAASEDSGLPKIPVDTNFGATQLSEQKEIESSTTIATSSDKASALSDILSPSGNYRRKEVVLLGKRGEVTHEFPSITAASAALDVPAPYISNCINGKKTTAGGFILRFKHLSPSTPSVPVEASDVSTRVSNLEATSKDTDPSLVVSDELFSSSSTGNCRRKEVVLLGEDGRVTREFPSVSAAAVALDMPAPYISNCINGKSPTAGGFVLRFKKSSTPAQTTLSETTKSGGFADSVTSPSTGNFRCKEVVLLDENGHVTQEYPSSSAAALALGVPAPYISNCINGKSPTAGGFVLRLKHSSGSSLPKADELLESRRRDSIQESNPRDQLSKSSDSLSPKPMGDYSRKEVVLLDENGKVARTFPSGAAASAALGVPQSYISLCVNGKIHDARGYVLRFKNSKAEGALAETLELKKRARNPSSNVKDCDIHFNSGDPVSSSSVGRHSRKEVVLLDDNGQVVRTFPSGAAASAALGVSQSYVSMCINGKVPDARGYVLRLKDAPENPLKSAEDAAEHGKQACDQDSILKESGVHDHGDGIHASSSVGHHSCKEVVLLDDNGQVVRTFPSGAAASAALGVPQSYVSMCINGKVPDARGYVLRLKDAPENPLKSAQDAAEHGKRARDHDINLGNPGVSLDEEETSVVKSPCHQKPLCVIDGKSSAPLLSSSESRGGTDLVLDDVDTSFPLRSFIGCSNVPELVLENGPSVPLASASKSTGMQNAVLDDGEEQLASADKSPSKFRALNDSDTSTPLDASEKSPGEGAPLDDDEIVNSSEQFNLVNNHPIQQGLFVNDGDASAPPDTSNKTPGEGNLTLIDNFDTPTPLNATVAGSVGKKGLDVVRQSTNATTIEGVCVRETRLSNRLVSDDSNAAASPSKQTMPSLQASDRYRAGVLPGLANPNQGPRHRLLIGATVPHIIPSSSDGLSTSAAAKAKVANLSTSPDVSMSVSSNANGALETAQSDLCTSTGVSSNSVPSLRDLGDSSDSSKRARWEVIASSHAPSHARARELWRCIQRGESSMPEKHAEALPMKLMETQPGQIISQKASQLTSRVVLPGTMYQARPLVSSSVNVNMSGKCKVWRLTPVKVHFFRPHLLRPYIMCNYTSHLNSMMFVDTYAFISLHFVNFESSICFDPFCLNLSLRFGPPLSSRPRLQNLSLRLVPLLTITRSAPRYLLVAKPCCFRLMVPKVYLYLDWDFHILRLLYVIIIPGSFGSGAAAACHILSLEPRCSWHRCSLGDLYQ